MSSSSGAAAIDAPAEFERLVSSRVNGVWTCTGVKNIRAWVTLRFMNEWRTNFEAHDGRSRRFYKAFLEAELHALREAEAAQLNANPNDENDGEGTPPPDEVDDRAK